MTIGVMIDSDRSAAEASIAPDAAREVFDDKRDPDGESAPPVRQAGARGASQPLDLAALFAAHHAIVFRSAYRITGNAADAEDVLQTIFLRLARPDGGRLSADLVTHPEAYLRRAAINAGLDIVRARERSAHVPHDDAAPLASRDAEVDPERRRAAGEVRDALRDALARMNNRSATAFALRHFEDLDNRQIARMLGTTPLAIGVMLHRARKVLRAEMKSFAENLR